jgi:hypothetical protein
MILGVDHLALSTEDTDAGIIDLERRGFTRRFEQRGVPNSPAKQGLLATYQPLHDLALFTHPDGGPAIELTNHGHVCAGKRGPFGYSTEAICLAVTPAPAEIEFWTGALRFKQQSPNLLRLVSPVPTMGCVVELQPGGSAWGSTLDSAGYTCLALHSTDLSRDLAQAADAGACAQTGPFDLMVNGIPLCIAMFRSPGGAIIELIQKRK